MLCLHPDFHRFPGAVPCSAPFHATRRLASGASHARRGHVTEVTLAAAGGACGVGRGTRAQCLGGEFLLVAGQRRVAPPQPPIARRGTATGGHALRCGWVGGLRSGVGAEAGAPTRHRRNGSGHACASAREHPPGRGRATRGRGLRGRDARPRSGRGRADRTDLRGQPAGHPLQDPGVRGRAQGRLRASLRSVRSASGRTRSTCRPRLPRASPSSTRRSPTPAASSSSRSRRSSRLRGG